MGDSGVLWHMTPRTTDRPSVRPPINEPTNHLTPTQPPNLSTDPRADLQARLRQGEQAAPPHLRQLPHRAGTSSCTLLTSLPLPSLLVDGRLAVWSLSVPTCYFNVCLVHAGASISPSNAPHPCTHASHPSHPPFPKSPPSPPSRTTTTTTTTGAGQVRHHLRGGPHPRDLHLRAPLQAGACSNPNHNNNRESCVVVRGTGGRGAGHTDVHALCLCGWAANWMI